ncbi:DUF1080 domain-containing protein, partial [bacterium]|nr:DUF1080 domain-containing protein [bacterium]
VSNERLTVSVDGKELLNVVRKRGSGTEAPGALRFVPLGFSSVSRTDVVIRTIAFRRPSNKAAAKAEPAAGEWRDLFDGKTLDGWRKSKWIQGKPGAEVSIKDGAIAHDGQLRRSVIVWDGEMPKTDYELAVSAMPLHDRGHFLEVTIPVGSTHYGFMTGGGETAMRFHVRDREQREKLGYKKATTYQVGRWHDIHFRVSKDRRVTVSVDGVQQLDVPAVPDGYHVAAFYERMVPMGICFARSCAVRSIRLRTGQQAQPPAAKVEQGVTPAQNAAAIDAGLAWLVKNQEKDGRWASPKGPNGASPDVGVTGLALLAFANTEADLRGKYEATVGRGVTWLVSKLGKDGRFEFKTFYEQGIGAMALCALTPHSKSASLRSAAQKAVSFICKEQPEHGGFRYKGACPLPEGDLSVASWQMGAMHLAREAGLQVPPKNIDRSRAFLANAYNDDGTSRYTIRMKHVPGKGSPSMTAIGGLFRHLFGGSPKKTKAAAEKLIEHLESPTPGPNPKVPTKRLGADIYYTYYAARFMHARGGDYWTKWNAAYRKPVIDLQTTKAGADRGSWNPANHAHCRPAGRACVTALAVLSLQLPMAGK